MISQLVKSDKKHNVFRYVFQGKKKQRKYFYTRKQATYSKQSERKTGKFESNTTDFQLLSLRFIDCNRKIKSNEKLNIELNFNKISWNNRNS